VGLYARTFISTLITTGSTQSIVIENKKGRLSEDDIDRMLREFESFAPTDATALPALLI
jgi:molecular chaperone DnaK (HSP70)